MLPLTLAMPTPIPALPILSVDGHLGWLILVGSAVVGFVAWAIAAGRARAALKRRRPLTRQAPSRPAEHRSLAA
jgi:hypothetical protein